MKCYQRTKADIPPFISFMGIIQCCLCKEHYPDKLNSHTFEPPHEKTNNLHIQNQRRRSASQKMRS